MREGRAFFSLAFSLAQGDNLSMGATWSARCSSLIHAAIVCSSNRLLTHPSAQIRHSAGDLGLGQSRLLWCAEGHGLMSQMCTSWLLHKNGGFRARQTAVQLPKPG